MSGRSVRSGLVLLIVAVLAVLSGCSGSKGGPEKSGSEFRFVEGTPSGEVIAKADRKNAPEITGKLLDDASFDLADHDGKIVVLNFWASWCAPCRVEIPDLIQIASTYGPDGVELVGVLVKDSKDQGEAYAKQVGMTYPSIFDPKATVALRFRGFSVPALPSTIVIDKQGKVAAVFVSKVELADLTSTTEKLLAE